MHDHSTSLTLARRLALAAAGTFAALTVAVPAFAAFPDKPIRIVVPFAPGGGTDMISRVVADGMAKELGQPVIVENKPGGGTIIGSDYVAKSPADGYTLVMATFAHAVNPSMQPKLPYQTEKAFAPVILIGRSPNVLVVRPDRPYKTVKEVLAAAQANPGKLTFGSQGNGTSAHLAGELFKLNGKVDMVHVPYRGAGPAITDLLGGQIDMMFGTVSAVAPFINSGKLRAIAVTTPERAAALEGVPTIGESGLPGYAAESWYGLYAPAGTPPAVIARLNAAAKRAVQSDVFRKRVQGEGLTVNAGAPAELDQYVRNETVRWSHLIRTAHITAD
jgi:tripartite-type tricarboxylate transporter receptor subunit TctC